MILCLRKSMWVEVAKESTFLEAVVISFNLKNICSSYFKMDIYLLISSIQNLWVSSEILTLFWLQKLINSGEIRLKSFFVESKLTLKALYSTYEDTTILQKMNRKPALYKNTSGLTWQLKFLVFLNKISTN